MYVAVGVQHAKSTLSLSLSLRLRRRLGSGGWTACPVLGLWHFLSRMSPRLATTQSRRLCVADREDHPLRNGGALAAASWVLARNLPRVWGAALAVGTDWLAYPSRLTAPRKEEWLHPGPTWARRMPDRLRRY